MTTKPTSEMIEDFEDVDALSGDGTKIPSVEAVKQYVNTLRVPTAGFLVGLGLSNNGTDADHDIDVAAGLTVSTDRTTRLELTAAQTKQLDASWATGDAAGGLSSTLTLTANTWYHCFVGLVGSTVEIGFDTSTTGANLATDHSFTNMRRIGSVKTKSGSADIDPFVQFGDDFYWDTYQSILNTGTVDHSAVDEFTMVVPLGFECEAWFYSHRGAQTNVHHHFWPKAATGYQPIASAGEPVASGINGSELGALFRVMTDTAQAIEGQSSGSNTDATITQFGYRDRRGQDTY